MMKEKMGMSSYIPVLTIAGSDSGGGAGIQADLKTFSALGCFGMSVITSITAQNTIGIRSIHGVPPSYVQDQLMAVLEDIPPKAIKVGMLDRPEIVEVVSEVLRLYPQIPLIVDPVMVASSGDRLIGEETVDSLKRLLFPIADLITPNLDEAKVLLGQAVRSKDEMVLAASKLLKWGSKGVLVKGGHLKGRQMFDVFQEQDGHTEVFEGSFIDTINAHGTGCTLSSAIASHLALGKKMSTSIKEAKEFVHKALYHGKNVKIGSGKGPLNHFFDPVSLKKV